MEMGPEIQPTRLYHRKRVSAFLIHETMLQIGTEEAWLWVAVELIQFTNKSLECISQDTGI